MFRKIKRKIKENREAKVINKLKLHGYEIPRWCRMSFESHADGIDGCWGITYEYVKEKGEDYCKNCEYYKENRE